MRGKTHPGHDGYEEVEEGLPVPCHVCFGQFDADGEDADCEYDAGEFEDDDICRYFVVACPCTRVEDVGAIRAYTSFVQWFLPGEGCMTHR